MTITRQPTSQTRMMLLVRLKSLCFSQKQAFFFSSDTLRRQISSKVGVYKTHRQPGLCNILVTCLIVSANFGAGVMSILIQSLADTLPLENQSLETLTFVMQTTTGTPRAKAIAKCSLDIPINPALAPTIKRTQDGAPEVRPYRVVLRYRSCPAKSKWRQNLVSIPTSEPYR